MKLVFALVFVLILVFAGYRFSFRRLSIPHLSGLRLTGTEFLFLGLLLGPGFAGLLDEPTLRGLNPLVGMVLGWVGLLFGFQFEIGKLRRFPREFPLAALLVSGITLAVVGAAAYLGLGFLVETRPGMQAAAALAMAGAAAASAQTGLALARLPELSPRRHHMVTVLRYISGVDGLAAVFALSLAFLFQPDILHQGLPHPRPSGMILVSTLSLIFAFTLLLNRRQPTDEMLMIVLAMTLLLGGLASVACFSPLVMNFLAGVWLVNASRHKERIYQFVERMEKPFYLLLLIFLGASWKLATPWIFAGAAVYFVLRASARVAGAALAQKILSGLSGMPPVLGLGLLEQGGLAMALMLEFDRAFPGPAAHAAVSLVLVAAVATDLVHPLFLKALAHRSAA
ncbi:MAG: hypothetical protein JRI97_11380 [Deltaproteobacteria bacterium]|nr:hypothetical protein [Deltaproteobacteria bacterium]